jgi:hypothetical protein
VARSGRAYPTSLAVKRRRYSQVSYDATGSGGTNTAGFNTSINTTWTHTANGPVVVGFEFRSGGQDPSTQTRTITYGGSNMFQLGTIATNTEQACDLWGFWPPPSFLGVSKTVSVTLTNSGTNTGWAVAGNSVSCTGVGAFGQVLTNSLSSSTSFLTVASAPGERIVQVIGAVQASQSAYTQNQHYTAQSGDGYAGVLLGDVPGGASVTGSSTLSTSTFWSTIGVRMMPAQL